MGMWRATAKSLTEESRWSSAHRAASGCTSPVPRWSAPLSQTSGTAPSARQKVQKEEQKLEREQKRGRITASSARRLQVSRRSHNKERRQITYNWLLEVFSWGWCACRNIRPPVSWAPSIHLSHHPPPTFHIRVQSHLTPWGLLTSQITIFFGSTQESFSIKCLSDYQCFKTDFR